MTLGERIRQEREKRGISQAELARRIGVSKNTMNMIEENKIADPRFSRVLAIARQLGMSHDVLVMRDGEAVEYRPAAELFAEPEHEYTRTLLAAVPPSRPRAAV